MSFFTRSDGPAQLVGSHERCHQQPTSTQPELDRPMRMLIDDQSDHYHQKQKRQKKNPRGCFRVAWFAETPNFAQQQTQVVGGTFQRVRFDHILLATQPSPPSAPGLTDMSEGSLASLASPPIQAPSLLCTHSSSVGPKGGLVSRRFVDPTPNLLSPLRDVSAHLPFGTPSQQSATVLALPASTTLASARLSVIGAVWASDLSAYVTTVATIASLTKSTACSALYAKCVRPSFILAIRLSGSVGLCHCSLETFLSLRPRSIRRRSSSVGLAIPSARAKPRRYSFQSAPLSLRTMLVIAALASSVVASMPTVLPRNRPFCSSRASTKVNTASKTLSGNRCRMIVIEACTGVASLNGTPKNARRAKLSAHRQAIPR